MADGADEALDAILEMGFSTAQASEALLDSGGDLDKAVALLLGGDDTGAADSSDKKKKGKRGKKGAVAAAATTAAAASDSPKAEWPSDSPKRDKKGAAATAGGSSAVAAAAAAAAAGYPAKAEAPSEPSKGEGARKESDEGASLGKKKTANEKKMEKMVCRTCGQTGHVHRDCPGVFDDGSHGSKGNIEHVRGGQSKQSHKCVKKGAASHQAKEAKALEMEAMERATRVPPATDEVYFDSCCDVVRLLEVITCSGADVRLAHCKGARLSGVRSLTGLLAEIRESPHEAPLLPPSFGGCISTCSDVQGYKDGRYVAAFEDELVWVALGVPPRDIAASAAGALQDISDALARDPRVCAVGLIGLDFTAEGLQSTDREQQIDGLRSQLKIAAAAGKPAIVSIREGGGADIAFRELLMDMLTPDASGGGGPTIIPSIVLHNVDGKLQGGIEMALVLHRELRVYLSFSGVVTHSKASRDLFGIAFDCPLKRLLIGTAAPELLPAVLSKGKSRICTPWDAVFVADKLAELKEVPLDAVLEASRQNAMALFGVQPIPKEAEKA